MNHFDKDGTGDLNLKEFEALAQVRNIMCKIFNRPYVLMLCRSSPNMRSILPVVVCAGWCPYVRPPLFPLS